MKLGTLVVLIPAVALACAAVAQERASLPASTDGLSYFTEEAKPYNFTENGELRGFSIELLRLMWEKMGVGPQKIQVVPWARGYKEVLTTSNAVLFSMSRLPEREKLFRWVGPIHITRFILVAGKDRDIQVASFDDIRKYKVATVIHDAAEVILVGKGLKAQLDPASDLKSAFRKLDLGRVDAIAYSANIVTFMQANGIAKENYRDIFTLAESFEYYAFHKDTAPEVINRFQAALDAVKQEAAFQRLETKYVIGGF